MHKRKCAEGEGTPGEWAASGSVQGAGRVCRRQGQGSMYRGSMPRHTARRATGRGVRANGHGVGRWYVQGVCTVCTERMKSQYIIYRRGNARDENGATAGVLGKGVGAPMCDAGARRSVGRQRAWLRVTGCAARRAPPPGNHGKKYLAYRARVLLARRSRHAASGLLLLQPAHGGSD